MQRELVTDAEHLLGDLRAARLTLATAESCTGGLVAAYLTEVAGSSDVVDRGFVTYSIAAKSELLGVPPALIEAHGAVSREVARAMAEGALLYSRARIAVAVTGVAGPSDGSAHKPVGLVWIAAARRGGPSIPPQVIAREFQFGDIGRGPVRRRAVGAAFAVIREVMA